MRLKVIVELLWQLKRQPRFSNKLYEDRWVVRFTFSSINSKVIMFDDWIMEGVILGKNIL